MNNAFTYYLLNQELLLLPQRAVLWKQQRALLLADLHLGKSGHFRRHGIAMPSAVHEHDLDRLSQLIAGTGAQKLFLLGDLFHSRENAEWNLFLQWRREFSATEIHLIKGNHDILDDERFRAAGLILHHESFAVPPFTLIHQMAEENRSPYQLCGHLHPAIRITGKGRQSISLPCFWFGKQAGVLPAFGGFTGSRVVSPAAADRVFFIAGEEVQEYRG